MESKVVKDLDWHLENCVDYSDKYYNYVPSQEALEYGNLVAAIYGGEFENETPIMHYMMFDAMHSGKNICLVAHRGSGKALGLDTKVMMAKGGVKRLDDIGLGELVLDGSGNPTKVIARSKVFEDESYNVKLTDGRTAFVACKDHKWHLTKKHRPCRNQAWRVDVRTTQQLVGDSKYLDPVKKDSLDFGLVKPVIKYSRRDTPSIPPEVFVKILLGNEEAGEYARDIFIAGGRELQGLRVYTPKDETFLPNTYKYGSLTTRIRTLISIIEYFDFRSNRKKDDILCFWSKQLAYDVLGIMKSIGLYATNIVRYDDFIFGRAPWMVDVTALRNMFRSEELAKRKLQRVKTADAKYGTSCSFIKSVEPIGIVPTRCITVESPLKTFLLDGSIPTGNSTVMAQNLFFFVAIYGHLPRIGRVKFAIYVSDTVQNGCKTMTSNMGYTYENSEFLKEMIPTAKFTEGLWEMTNVNGEMLSVRIYGAEALSLDTRLHTVDGELTIGECSVGDRIFGSDGKLATITDKSVVFNKPMYRISLVDGRSIKVSDDHINSVLVKERVYKPRDMNVYTPKDLRTTELLEMPLIKGRDNQLFIQASEPLEYPDTELPIDPYSLGLLLGDGTFRKDSGSARLTSLDSDWTHYEDRVPYSLGTPDVKNGKVITRCFLGVFGDIHALGLDQGSKFIPEMYFYGSVDQRLALLRGLMDTDGSLQSNGRIDFSSHAPVLMRDFVRLARSLGMVCKVRSTSKEMNGKVFIGERCEIWSKICPVTLPRKVSRFKPERFKARVAITSIERIPDEPSQCIVIDNDDHQFIVDEFVRTHNSGIRGGREQNTRPNLAVIDDVLNDKNAVSETKLNAIKKVIFAAINYALHPKNMKILIGTPFHSKCVVSEAVASGSYYNLVFPIAENFPCERQDFKGSWGDRFGYDEVMKIYNEAKSGLGDLSIQGFYQELMLSPSGKDRTLVKRDRFRAFSRETVLGDMTAYHFYITTDFATTDKESSDLSVILVWAYNSAGEWHLMDGYAGKSLMDENIDKLFAFVEAYPVQEVGIEINGQQGGFIQWIRREMEQRSLYFKFATSSIIGNRTGELSSVDGIKSTGNKMQRFMNFQPVIQQRKVLLAYEHTNSFYQQELLDEFLKITPESVENAFYDDVIDSVTMLQNIRCIKPTVDAYSGPIIDPLDFKGTRQSMIFDIVRNNASPEPEGWDDDDGYIV